MDGWIQAEDGIDDIERLVKHSHFTDVAKTIVKWAINIILHKVVDIARGMN